MLHLPVGKRGASELQTLDVQHAEQMGAWKPGIILWVSISNILLGNHVTDLLEERQVLNRVGAEQH